MGNSIKWPFIRQDYKLESSLASRILSHPQDTMYGTQFLLIWRQDAKSWTLEGMYQLERVWSVIRPDRLEALSQSVGLLEWARSSSPSRPSVRNIPRKKIGEITKFFDVWVIKPIPCLQLNHPTLQLAYIALQLVNTQSFNSLPPNLSLTSSERDVESSITSDIQSSLASMISHSQVSNSSSKRLAYLAMILLLISWWFCRIVIYYNTGGGLSRWIFEAPKALSFKFWAWHVTGNQVEKLQRGKKKKNRQIFVLS